MGNVSAPGKEVCSLTLEGFLFFKLSVTWAALASAIMYVEGKSLIKYH